MGSGYSKCLTVNKTTYISTLPVYIYHKRPSVLPITLLVRKKYQRREITDHFPASRWEDNIKMDLREVGVGGGDWMELAQDRDRWRSLVNTVMNFRVR